MPSTETDLKSKKSKNLFIITPIGDPESQTRIRSDLVKKHIIDPVAKENGYESFRSDLICEPGRIDSQIIDHLTMDEIVVADITDQNPNVFYELAVRHTVGKPVILLGEIDQKIPFDIRAQRVIWYDLSKWDSVPETQKELEKQLSSVEAKSFITDSPVKTHVILSSFEKKYPEFKEILVILKNQNEMLSKLERNFNLYNQSVIELQRSQKIVEKIKVVDTKPTKVNGLACRHVEISKINILKNLINLEVVWSVFGVENWSDRCNFRLWNMNGKQLLGSWWTGLNNKLYTTPHGQMINPGFGIQGSGSPCKHGEPGVSLKQVTAESPYCVQKIKHPIDGLKTYYFYKTHVTIDALFPIELKDELQIAGAYGKCPEFYSTDLPSNGSESSGSYSRLIVKRADIH